MIVSVVNDVFSTIDGVCDEGVTGIPSTQTSSMVDNTSFTTDTIIYT
jgi:hypothetical protein